ncbi:hypothetical protein [Nannocystis radixulma]|uniref:Lipoprotein n=1 Tax=Nannocystis radixulma TaxID=2995305 RepID=A0ABT5BG97_9BACT|nr:hypothetical protein [Nannocystis radixulma]MDC0669085.1 hypothetical protein [Nannocystis radixulma]MDC0673155.1 hypothetical protein [Nannocystis radixulma]MDC0673158.1 hypothetical protein [Nannocystis radixulma]
MTRPVIHRLRLLSLALLLGCPHLVPPAEPAENGLPVRGPTSEQPLPDPVRAASARAHGGCDTGAQCSEHLDANYKVEDEKRTCEAAGGRWLHGPCPHLRAHGACITPHFLVFDYDGKRAEYFGASLHRDLAEAREACLTHGDEFYELTP